MSNNLEAGEEEELSALEYARRNGLTRNHLSEPLPFSLLDDVLENLGDVRGSIDHNLTSEDGLADFSTDERLTISKDGARFLSWVSHPDAEEVIDGFVCSTLDGRQIKKMRLELPLLKSDHETDCKEFARRDDFEIKLKDVRLPLEMVDEEKSEGLRFPSRVWNLGAEKIEELKKERISVTKETMQYICDGLRAEWTDSDEESVWKSEQKYRTNSAIQPVTPPLSPIAFPPQPFEPSPSDPAFQIPIFSDPESLTQYDLDALEKGLHERDIPTPIRNALAEHDESSSDAYCGDQTARLANTYYPLVSLGKNSSSPTPETRYVKRESLRVEEILTPPKPVPIQKAVHFNDFIEEMILETPSPPHSEAFETKYLEHALGDAAARATRQIEQEQLIAADATGRVEVPVRNFSLPDPPWKKFQNLRSLAILSSLQRAVIKDTVGNQLEEWRGHHHDRGKLIWSPFPRDLAKIAQKEDFPADDTVWQLFLNRPEDDQISDTSALTWKPPGLRILKDNEDDEYIEAGKFEIHRPLDISYLVKKRKRELEQRTDCSPRQDSINLIRPASPRNNMQNSTGLAAVQNLQNTQTDSGNFGLLMGGVFSAENALDNFLELRGTKKLKLSDSSYFATKPKAQVMQTGLQNQLPERNSRVKVSEPLPIPPLPHSTCSISVVVSSALLKQRTLIKYIESQIPELTLIERDFTAHNKTVWLPDSVTRSPIASPLDSEADLIISPSTGIILTNLQKIKQKSLPGQKTKPAVRERLEKISNRYKKLIVLVSECYRDENTNGLDGNDCNAFSEFQGFALGLESNVVVQFVGGGDETLSKWLANIIVQQGANGNILLDDETHWELFLRRAGMNAFAAQFVMAILKAPDGVDPQSSSKKGHFGLAAFVEMGRHQRMATFTAVCGERLLERVSDAVDARWE